MSICEAQVVKQKIGDNPTVISAATVLDVESTNKGVLLPRIALTSATDNTTITTPIVSMLVFNTATAGATPNQVIPGFYYWTGTNWSRMASGNVVTVESDGIIGNEVVDAVPDGGLIRTGTGTDTDPYLLKINDGTTTGQVLTWDGAKWIATETSADWKLAGNSGTSAGTDFIGTTDANDLIFKTDSTEHLAIYSALQADNSIVKIAGGDLVVNDITVGKGLSNNLYNTGLGYQALFHTTTGERNTAVGVQSQLFTDTGGNNSSIGAFALSFNVDGTDNAALGTQALYENTSGNANTAVGAHALEKNTTGNDNVAAGKGSLFKNTTGNSNVAMGLESMYSNSVGIENTAVGIQSLYFNTTGSGNTVQGAGALAFNTTGSYNTVAGYFSFFNSTGNNNVGLGYNAGFNQTAGDNNIAIGTNTDLPNLTASNQLNIGNFVYGTGMTGNLAGYLGIGTSAPKSKMELSGALGLPLASISTDTTLTDNHAVVLVNASSGDVALTLPNATEVANRIYNIVKTDTSVNKIIFSTTIQANGFTFIEANVAGEYKIQSDGTNWVLIQ